MQTEVACWLIISFCSGLIGLKWFSVFSITFCAICAPANLAGEQWQMVFSIFFVLTHFSCQNRNLSVWINWIWNLLQLWFGCRYKIRLDKCDESTDNLSLAAVRGPLHCLSRHFCSCKVGGKTTTNGFRHFFCINTFPPQNGSYSVWVNWIWTYCDFE